MCSTNVRFGCGVWCWMRRRNQKLESDFASQKVALGSTWEAARTKNPASPLPGRGRQNVFRREEQRRAAAIKPASDVGTEMRCGRNFAVTFISNDDLGEGGWATSRRP